MTRPHMIFAAMGAALMLGACDGLPAIGGGDATPPTTSTSPADTNADTGADTGANTGADTPPAIEDSDVAPASARPARPTAKAGTADIDWEAARTDLASRPSEEREDAFQIASGAEAPPVPVLLPSGIVLPAGSESQVRFQPLEDGYFAAYPGTTYDIIVNGTNEVIGSGERSNENQMQFLATAAGAQVALSRYGADYLVEFECNEIDGATGTCITEDDAIDIAERLVVAGSR